VYICDETTGACDFVIGDFTRVTEWSQSGPDYGEEVTEDNIGTLDDQSWENPFDISKGHRGYMDGDFIMVLYAWSPNYKQNAVGHDHYNLYVRRSFDGGVTWSTTPASFTHTDGVTYSGDGTTFVENFGWGTDAVYEHEYVLSAGEFEPSRNVSQLIGSRETILDPRYSPTKGSIEQEDGTFLYPDDERDPSKFFVVYETGDNTTVTTGEATPLDLYYSRATDWGDDYDLVEYEKNDGEIVLAWDWLEKGDPESGEAAITSNSAGNFFYAAWNQALEIGEEEFTDMDVYFRRIMYLDDTEADPIVSILYISHTMADFEDDLLFVGSARDGDHVDGLPHEDIAEVLWTDTFDGVTTVVGNQKQLNIPAQNLQPGWHTFTFSAKDKGGRWSPGVSFDVWIVEELSQVFLPATMN
jgi:hypothetical protein